MAFDILIRDAEIHDGLGSRALRADLAIAGERIARIGDLAGARAGVELDAAGRCLAPGFIDVHTHDDFAALHHPDMLFKARGGVTTCIVGNCGFGAAPFAQAVELLASLSPGPVVAPYRGHAGYARRLEQCPTGVNIGVLAGHGTLRLAAMGRAARHATGSEIRHMQTLLEEALEAGVFGLSSGLIYEPGRHAGREELTELAAIMRGRGALYASHLRDEGAGLLESVAEAIAIGERAGVGVQISHHKASGRANWGLVEQSLALIEAAQARGLAVFADQYPYTAGSTSLKAILDNGAFTPAAATGGIGVVAASDVIIAAAPGQPQWEGQTVADLSTQFALPPRQAAERITASAPATTVVVHMMSERDVQTVMGHRSTMIGSDGIPTLDGKPHPRLYNSFARVLGHYARDLGIFDLPTAIHRMTGFAAHTFGLHERGRVVEGAYADLVVFDAAEIRDRGTFEAPNQYPDGITDVFVNGTAVIRQGQPCGQRPGHVLRRSSS